MLADRNGETIPEPNGAFGSFYRPNVPFGSLGLRGPGQEATPAQEEAPHPMDQFVPDPTGKPALCNEAMFANILAGIVADSAPQIFAVIQEYGTRVDARVAAWGMAFPGHAEVVAVEHGFRMNLNEPAEALPAFRIGTRITPRLVWFNPAARTPDDETC